MLHQYLTVVLGAFRDLCSALLGIYALLVSCEIPYRVASGQVNFLFQSLCVAGCSTFPALVQGFNRHVRSHSFPEWADKRRAGLTVGQLACIQSHFPLEPPLRLQLLRSFGPDEFPAERSYRWLSHEAGC